MQHAFPSSHNRTWNSTTLLLAGLLASVLVNGLLLSIVLFGHHQAAAQPVAPVPSIPATPSVGGPDVVDMNPILPGHVRPSIRP